ncbi:Heat Shock Protein 70, partial [Reticulomyxa filosa]
MLDFGDTKAIGIDFGTSLFRIGGWKDGSPEELQSGDTVVALSDNEESVVARTKLLIGKQNQKKKEEQSNNYGALHRYNEVKAMEHCQLCHFYVAKGVNDELVYKLPSDKQYTPSQILIRIMKLIKEVASEDEEESAFRAFEIMTPFFCLFVRQNKKSQSTKKKKKLRKMIRNAAEEAGIEVIELLDEHKAAALCYWWHNRKEIRSSKKVVIVDWGSGKLGVSLAHIEEKKIKMEAVTESVKFGGEDITNRLVAYMAGQFTNNNKDHYDELTRDVKVVEILRSHCVEAQAKLSTQKTYKKVIRDFHQGKNFQFNLSRTKYIYIY